MSRITRHLSPAMVVALVALASSLTGGAVAASLITGKQVKNSSLTGADVKDRSLTGKDVRKSSLGADRLTAAARAALKGTTGPAGAPGVPGPKGDPGVQGPPGTPDGYTKSEADGRFTARAGSVVFTQSAKDEDYSVIDINGTNTSTASRNGGLRITPTGGDNPRSIFVLGRVTAPTVPASGATATALHLCYRATQSVRLDQLTLGRYRPTNLDQTALQLSTQLLQDSTERTDATCRRYALTGDRAILPGDSYELGIEIEVTSNANTNSNRFVIFSTALEVIPG